MSSYWWIGLGGFLGANARYLVSQWAAAHGGLTFPYGTILVNLSGSLILCFLVSLLGHRGEVAPVVRLTIMVGFLGSYTTFSTFSNEWLQLLERGQILQAAGYLVSSVIGGGLMGGLGLWLGRAVA